MHKFQLLHGRLAFFEGCKDMAGIRPGLARAEKRAGAWAGPGFTRDDA
jgi:hypothetical protein